jgi:hypothetical protein
MDCTDCGLQISSEDELRGYEMCLKCRLDEPMDLINKLMREGWGSQSAADEVQRRLKLNDSDTLAAAYYCELYRE